MMLSNGLMTDNQMEIAQELGKAYKEIFTARDPYVEGDLERFLGPIGIQKLGNIKLIDRNLCERLFSMTELEDAAKNIKKEGAGGADKVTGSIFHYIFPKTKHLFLNLANTLAFSDRHTLKRSKRVNLIFLPKDTDKTNYKMVRPIGLSSNLYKLVSHLQAIRIRNAMINAQLYPSNLFAYLKGRRGDFAARILRDRLEIACNKEGDIMLGFQFDISGAFDNISREYLCALFKLLGFGNNFILTIRNMFQNISIKPHYGNHEIPQFNQLSGVIQGGPSSVQFFIIGTIPLTIKLEMEKGIESYHIDLESISKVKIMTKKILINTDDTAKGYDKNFVLKKSAHFADDSYGFVKFQGVDTIKKIINIYEGYGRFAAQPINRDKTRLCFSSVIDKEPINQIIQLGFKHENIIQPGGAIKFVGYRCQVAASQLKTDYQVIKERSQKIMDIIEKWDFNNLTNKGRRIIANSLCISQLSYFFPNMSCQESWFNKAQQRINYFVNKKKITVKKLLYLACKKGGTGAPWLYLKYLIAKAKWFKILGSIEEQDRNMWPDFATLLINLKNKFHFPTFKVLCYAGDNDWSKLANICFAYNLKFWGNTIYEFLKLRKLFKKPKRTHTTKGQKPIVNWGDINIFGSKYRLYKYKSGKDGWSIKQLLRPPEGLSLSSRNNLVADTIQTKGFYKVAHFIDSNNRPTANITVIYNTLRLKYQSNQVIHFLDFVYCNACEIKKLIGGDKAGSRYMVRDFLLENMLGLENTISLYNRVTAHLFTPNEHPCLEKWNNTNVGIKLNNRKIMSGLHRIFSTTMCYIHLKYAQEAILCAIRTEKHLSKMPDHPTGQIRPCNICFGGDSLHHILISCPLAQLFWLRLKLAIQAVTRQKCEITIEAIILSKLTHYIECSKAINKFVVALICATRYVLMSIYYRRSNNFSIEEASQKLLENIKSTVYLYKKYKIDIPVGFYDCILGHNKHCGDEIFDLLLKIRATLYIKNINVDNNPKLYNISVTMFNRKGKKIDHDLDYLRYCLKNCMERDLITRLPILMHNPYESMERKSKVKEMSKYKLKFLSQMAVEEYLDEDTKKGSIQVSEYDIIFNLSNS